MDQFERFEAHRRLVDQCRDTIALARQACLHMGLPDAHVYVFDPGDTAGLGHDLFVLWSTDRPPCETAIPAGQPGVVVTAMPADRSVRWLTAYTPGMPPLAVSRLADQGCFWLVVAAYGCLTVTQMDPAVTSN
jgi:hypothetical protein